MKRDEIKYINKYLFYLNPLASNNIMTVVCERKKKNVRQYYLLNKLYMFFRFI
jgi:hypothetical protein